MSVSAKKVQFFSYGFMQPRVAYIITVIHKKSSCTEFEVVLESRLLHVYSRSTVGWRREEYKQHDETQNISDAMFEEQNRESLYALIKRIEENEIVIGEDYKAVPSVKN